MHLELVSATATAPSTGAAAAAIAGDSLTVKNGRGKQHVIALWGKHQTAGFVQLAFPSAHDTTRGYRSGMAAGNFQLLPFGMKIPLNAQELMSVTIAGSATAGDVEAAHMLIRYDDVPGMDARLITPAQLEARVEKLTTVEASIITTAGPSYGTPEALNADSDLLQANRDYAVLGAYTRTVLGAVYLVGPDTANVRIGVPGAAHIPEITSQWFPLLSRATGQACIPVISSGNKTSTFIGGSADENAGTFLVTWYLALLK